MSSPTEKQYRLLNATSSPQADSRVNLDPGVWKTPVTIDDADLTFDGKPLNLLHEENKSRWMLEHHVFEESNSPRGRRRKIDDSRRGEVSESFFLWSFPSTQEGQATGS
jgi:hypothetical protein